MTEKTFETKIKKFLEAEGCYCRKIWGGGMQKAGLPDLFICCNGFFLAIEVKSDKGRPSELQLYELDQIKKSGGTGLVLYPKDFDSFKELIRQMKEGDGFAMEFQPGRLL